MRKIAKGKPLEAFTAYVRQHRPRQWEELPREIGRQCRLHILEKEQEGLGGYTEKLLDEDSTSLHIDHFRKRELYNADVFTWDNFIVDEKNTPYGADAKDGRNGVKSREEYSMIVNPVEEDPHHFFEYMTDGQIKPSDALDDTERKKAQHTIDVFNLNHSALCDLRKNKIRQVKELKAGNISAEDVLEYLRHNGFPSVVEYFCQPQIFMRLCDEAQV